MTYGERLVRSAEATGNCLCMGLDPRPEAPEGLTVGAFFRQMLEAVRAAGLEPAAFKPNIGYWARLDRPLEGDFSGSRALADVLGAIRTLFPRSLVILDSKRGDIARSSENYAAEAFLSWGADAVTVAPYMGTDSVRPFVDDGHAHGVYVLCRTSNPGARDLQDQTMPDGRPFFLHVADRIREWGTGAVVGATDMAELAVAAGALAASSAPLLIPGVGSQGGSATEVLATLRKAGYDPRLARINSSSGLTYPWKQGPVPQDWRGVVCAAVRRLVEETKI